MHSSVRAPGVSAPHPARVIGPCGAALFAALPAVGRYLPGKAGDALAGRAVDDLLAPGVGAAVLAAWTLAFVVAATVRSDRSDV
jgi:hypothetical protein